MMLCVKQYLVYHNKVETTQTYNIEKIVCYQDAKGNNLAREWWYHGLGTLRHANITSYVDFTQNVMDRFDQKDHEIHFRELA